MGGQFDDAARIVRDDGAAARAPAGGGPRLPLLRAAIAAGARAEIRRSSLVLKVVWNVAEEGARGTRSSKDVIAELRADRPAMLAVVAALNHVADDRRLHATELVLSVAAVGTEPLTWESL